MERLQDQEPPQLLLEPIGVGAGLATDGPAVAGRGGTVIATG